MKKLLLLLLLLFVINNLKAQDILSNNNPGPRKFKDVILQHKNKAPIEYDEYENTNKNQKEGKDHLFQKWEWYWKQHLDKNGFIVPNTTNTLEWEKYIQNHSDNYAQKTTSFPSSWVFMGPNSTPGGYAGIGRINTVAFDPIDSNIVYVGAAGGGTWKTTNGGSTWFSLYDHLATMGVADIKVNPLNHNTVYVATGDADNWDAYCAGIIKSYNGGLTWITTGLTWLPTNYYSARSLIINPIDTNTMLLGTNYGLFKTYNAGLSWTNIASGDFKQVLYKPNDTNIVYGTIYVGSTAQIERSVNGGNTWTVVTSFTDAQRINVAVCPANPTLVDAIVSNTSSGLEGIYTSTNSGLTFSPVYLNDTTCVNNLLSYDINLPSTSCGGQGWYDLCIAISPTNPNEITVGGVNTYYSSDGGVSWQIANTWYDGGTGVQAVHADKHCLAYNPLTNALFETCDGGVYKNYGPVSQPWINLCSGLCVTEFYRNAVANGVDFCIGGAQDNGTKMMSSTGSTDLAGGDGMQPLINYGDPSNVFFASCQNGYIMMTRDGGVNFFSISDTLHSSGGWITPYILHPTDTGTLLLGYKNVFVSTNSGTSWSPISPVFDSNSYINILKIAPSNPNYIYAEYDDYNIWKSVVYYTSNFGVTWDTIHIPFTNFISDIAIDPIHANRICITVSGYSGTDKVYKYDLVTNIWTNITGSLPNLPVNCILIDTNTHTQYIGTDAAIFVRDTLAADWALYNNHLPTVHVTDLNINYTTGDIWAATYGRGMWKSNKSNIPNNVAKTNPVNTDITLSPNPNSGNFTINSANLKSADVEIRLINTAGSKAWSINTKFDNNGLLKIATNTMPAGFYICEIINETGVVRKSVVIMPK